VTHLNKVSFLPFVSSPNSSKATLSSSIVDFLVGFGLGVACAALGPPSASPPTCASCPEPSGVLSSEPSDSTVVADLGDLIDLPDKTDRMDRPDLADLAELNESRPFFGMEGGGATGVPVGGAPFGAAS
jgi:hypothetical protein